MIAGYALGRMSMGKEPPFDGYTIIGGGGGGGSGGLTSSSPPPDYKAEFIMPDRVSEILSKKSDATLDDVIL